MAELSEILFIFLFWILGMILTIAFYAIIVAVVIFILLWLLQMFGVIALMVLI